jgi:hypothetical protein
MKNENSSIPKKKFCMIHGHGTHSSDDCKTLQALAKKQKTSFQDSSKGTFSNKTWSRKAEEASSKSKKELAAFINKQVAKGVAKKTRELAAMDKKRKASDSDAEDGEVELDLEQFNYSDMENLQLDDDSVSV